MSMRKLLSGRSRFYVAFVLDAELDSTEPLVGERDNDLPESGDGLLDEQFNNPMGDTAITGDTEILGATDIPVSGRMVLGWLNVNAQPIGTWISADADDQALEEVVVYEFIGERCSD